jgi:medium-chain acyl-[acyl-carrier-protein] hydrolase
MNPLVDALAEELRTVLDAPFAFFGHSMGARVSFGLAHRLAELERPGPALLLLSGTPGPSVRDWKHAHRLSESELIDHLTGLGGLPQAILDKPELLRRLLPTLRADLELSEMSRLEFGWKFDRPVVAFAGADDQLATPQRVGAWRTSTTGQFTLNVLPGDHFFNQTSIDTVVGHVVEAVSLHLTDESLSASGS